MSQSLPLQEAEDTFCENLSRAEAGEVQIVTKHGVATAVVMSYAAYKMLSEPRQRQSQLRRLILFFQSMGPFFGTLLQQVLTNTRELFRHFFENDDQKTKSGEHSRFDSALSIEHIFSILVGTCAAIVYPMAIYRSDLGEAGDRFLVVTALCIIVATFVLLQAAPRFFSKVSTYIGAKIALLLMVLWFLVAGFREDDFPVPFAGLGSIVLVCLLLIVIVIPLIRNTVLAPVFRLLTNVASVLIVLMGLYTVSVSVDLWHNVFIINEMITPLTSLIAYSSFIPQYMNVFQFFPWFLDLVGVTQFPDLTMQIIYVFLQFMSIVTIALAVSLNYHFMHKRSLFLALLFTVPLFFISSRPFWDYSKNYYTVQLFTYSLVPVRMFAVFSIGCIAVFLLHKNTQDTRKSLMYASLCGIFAGIGVYQSNDFGLFGR